MIGLALVVILLLLGSILLFIRRTWSTDRISSGLFVPYAAWVAFATLLNASLLWLN
jgi:tryptophan-rich sensory protein